ncbi:hypothetical protein [Methylorubrum populi]|nr:hypothetical protein [Methylorubrum populi]
MTFFSPAVIGLTASPARGTAVATAILTILQERARAPGFPV